MNEKHNDAERLMQLANLIQSSKIVDLSVTLEKGIPRWPAHPALIIDPTATHEHDGYANQTLVLAEHIGTHMDAPFHIHGDLRHRTIEHEPPDAVLGRCTVIDLADKQWNPGERASLNDLQSALEKCQTIVAEGDIVLIHYGWMKHWTTGSGWSYYGQNQPGLTEDAAEFLLTKKVKAVGTDTAAVGTPVIEGKAVGPCYFHEVVLREGIYLIECLTNLDKLPAHCFFMAAPLKIAGGTGSPIRALALIP